MSYQSIPFSSWQSGFTPRDLAGGLNSAAVSLVATEVRGSNYSQFANIGGAFVEWVPPWSAEEEPAGNFISAGLITPFTRTGQDFFGTVQSITLYVKEGRAVPGAVAQGSLIRRGFFEDGAVDVGDGLKATSLENAGGLFAFLEKTPSGFGTARVRVSLRELSRSSPRSDFPAAFPLLGNSSEFHSIFNLLTVSRVNSEGQEETLVSKIVLAGNYGVRLGLGSDSQEEETRLCVHLCRSEGGICFVAAFDEAHSAGIDETLFGGISPDSLEVVYGGLPGIGENVDGFSRSLRIAGVTHDATEPVAFSAGMLQMPNFSGPGFFSSRRSGWDPSMLPVTVHTQTICCGPTTCDADLNGSGTGGLPPMYDYAAAPEPFQVERFPTESQEVTANSLAVSASFSDMSCLEKHSTQFVRLPQDGKMHLLGKSFESAEIEFAAVNVGQAESLDFSRWGKGVLLLPKDRDLTLQEVRDFFSFSFTRNAFNSVISGSFKPPPIGEASCSAAEIGSLTGESGVLSGEYLMFDYEYQASIDQDGEGPQAPLDFRNHTIARCEVACVFGVGLQENGTVTIPVEGNTPEYFRETSASPNMPKGKVRDIVFETGNNQSGPVLGMRLFTRVVAWYELEDSVANRQNYGDTGLFDHGMFIFNRTQTASLMNGTAVAPTRWMEAADSERPVFYAGNYIWEAQTTSPWPLLRTVIKGVRLI